MLSGTAEIVVLYNKYDPCQYWLPIGNFIFVKTQRRGESSLLHLHEQSLQRLKEEASHKFYRVGNYPYDIDPNQLPLVFPHFNKLSKNHYAKIKRAGFPGWEGHENGETLKVSIKSIAKVVDKWLSNNCMGYYYKNTEWVDFQKEAEAVMFRLAFS